MFLTPVLLILAGLVITFIGVGIGSRIARRQRSLDRGRARADRGGLACGVVVLIGAVAVVLGIADGIFLLVTGA